MRMRSVRCAALACVIATLAMACSWLVEIHDVTSGRAADAATGDSAATPTDAVANSEGGAVRGCAAHPDAIFCADFDADPSPETGWHRFVPTAGADLTTDGTDPFSPPRSLLLTIGSADARSRLERDLGDRPARLEVTFAVRPEPTGSTYAELVRLTIGSNQDFRFRLIERSLRVQHKYTPDATELDDKLVDTVLPAQTWTTVSLSLDFVEKTYTCKLGTEVRGSGKLAFTDGVSAPATLSIGSVSLESGFTSGTFHLDDVVVRAPPPG